MNFQMSHHHFFKGIVACAILASAALSPVAYAQQAPTPANTQTTTTIAPVQALYTALKTAQKSGKTARQRSVIIAPAVDQAFDLEAILRRSIGLRYASLSPADHARLLASFRQFTIARYASSFKPGDEATFTIQPETRPSPTGGQIVDTTIGGSDSATPINYIMTSGNSGWRITDILLDAHISQVAAQRADFGAAFTQGGADGLATMLDNKTSSFLHD